MKIKPATPEELEKIKDHFELQGYGRIEDSVARAQTKVLKVIRRRNVYQRSKTDKA